MTGGTAVEGATAGTALLLTLLEGGCRDGRLIDVGLQLEHPLGWSHKQLPRL